MFNIFVVVIIIWNINTNFFICSWVSRGSYGGYFKRIPRFSGKTADQKLSWTIIREVKRINSHRLSWIIWTSSKWMIVDDSAWWLVVKRKRARQAPILSQTCLSLPHSSWQVKIFLSADNKSASGCGGLNYNLGLDLEVLEPRHLHCSQILVWVLGEKNRCVHVSAQRESYSQCTKCEHDQRFSI